MVDPKLADLLWKARWYLDKGKINEARLEISDALIHIGAEKLQVVPYQPVETTPTQPIKGGSWNRLIQAMKVSGISDPMRIAMMSQFILESGRGTTLLALNHCNFAGMKYRDELAGLAKPVKYQAHDGLDTYCEFPDEATFIKGYLKFIQRTPYKGWENHSGDPLAYITFIKSKGYAEDPNYIAKVSRLFPEAADLLGIPMDRPNTEPPPELSEPVDGVTTPIFVKIPGISFTERGKYNTPTGMFDGLVVHYTVSGRTPQSARNVVNWLDSQGYGCMTMDENGTIYMPEDFDIMRDTAYHAGASGWDGRKDGLSTYYAGMEICCWGRNSKVGPFRTSGDVENIIAGTYQEYLSAQEKSLINFILWALKKNPGFKISNIVGHDEIRTYINRRGDKQDPGASLSSTMPALRAFIEKEAKRLGIR